MFREKREHNPTLHSGNSLGSQRLGVAPGLFFFMFSRNGQAKVLTHAKRIDNQG